METISIMKGVDSSVLESNKPPAAIRITGVNTDKTRKVAGSQAIYHVYCVLSDGPTGAWRDAFAAEWKRLGTTNPQYRHAASIDGAFLVVECSLGEVGDILLPALKQAVAAANSAYKNYVHEQEGEQVRKEDVWKDERASVEEMARSLHFE